MAAKVALFVGLAFYVSMTFILKVDLHFVHLWGIEFLLNVGVMYLVSYFYPNKNFYRPTDSGEVELTPWRYTRLMAISLVVITLLIYFLLS